MLILAIESSAKPVSAAILETAAGSPQDNTANKLLGLYFQNNGFSHSRTMLVIAESLLKKLDIKPADIGLVAVSQGPGSFTGVRIGVSAAKGLAWGLDIPVCGVSTLEAMAYQTPEQGVIICPVMDARRGQVYNALFEWREKTLVRLTDDRAISMEELSSELRDFDRPCLLVGDGTAVCEANSAFKDCRIASELQRYQTAYGVALAAMNAKPVSAAELEPSYLRPSQAERERANKG